MSDDRSTNSNKSFYEKLSQAVAGDKSALGRLLAPFRPKLRNEAERVLSVGLAKDQDASDMAQQALNAAANNIGKFRGENRAMFGGWLRGILRNVTRRRIRVHAPKVKMHVSLGAHPAGDEVLPASGIDVLEQLSLREQVARLHEAIGELEEDDRRIIQYRFLEEGGDEAKYDQLAEQMGIRPDALRQRTHRLLRRMELGLVLLQAMDRCRMPPHYRRVLAMRHFRGYSPSRIAVELKCTERAAKSLLAQARGRLPDAWHAHV